MVITMQITRKDHPWESVWRENPSSRTDRDTLIGWDTYSRKFCFKMEIKFWHNVWCDNRALKEALSRML